MRLKTKFQDEDFDLGEVVEANVYNGGSGRIKVIAEPTKGGMITFYFETLKGLNEMFEDYEEPKEYWYIDPMVCGVYYTKIKKDEDLYDFNKQIGNYFSSREEAEKAVEKLRAWKRLKDKGMHVTTFYVEDGSLVIRTKTHNSSGAENWEDLNICFGDEE